MKKYQYRITSPVNKELAAALDIEYPDQVITIEADNQEEAINKLYDVLDKINLGDCTNASVKLIKFIE